MKIILSIDSHRAAPDSVMSANKPLPDQSAVGANGVGKHSGSTPEPEAQSTSKPTAFTSAEHAAGTRLQALIRGNLARNKVSVSTVSRGIVNVKINGNSEFLDRIAMPGMSTKAGPKRIEYLAVSNDRFSPHLAGGEEIYRPKSMSGAELKKVLNKKRQPGQGLALPSLGRKTAYINGGYYNSGHAGIPASTRTEDLHKFKEHSSIGDNQVIGAKMPANISPPEHFADEYHSMTFPDGSKLTSGPLLADESGPAFTAAKSAEPRYQYSKDHFRPGHLSHAEHPNPRSAISAPAEFGARSTGPASDNMSAKTNSTRLIIGKSGAVRGKNSDGFTMVEWSTVTSRLGSLNQHPGKAINLDGGASTVLGVIGRSGKKRMEAQGVSGMTPTTTTFIALQETRTVGSVVADLLNKRRSKKT